MKAGPDRIKRSTVVQTYKKGGMRMVDFEQFIYALKLILIRRSLMENNKSRYWISMHQIYQFVKDSSNFEISL